MLDAKLTGSVQHLTWRYRVMRGLTKDQAELSQGLLVQKLWHSRDSQADDAALIVPVNHAKAGVWYVPGSNDAAEGYQYSTTHAKTLHGLRNCNCESEDCAHDR